MQWMREYVSLHGLKKDMVHATLYADGWYSVSFSLGLALLGSIASPGDRCGVDSVSVGLPERPVLICPDY